MMSLGHSIMMSLGHIMMSLRHSPLVGVRVRVKVGVRDSVRVRYVDFSREEKVSGNLTRERHILGYTPWLDRPMTHGISIPS